MKAKTSLSKPGKDEEEALTPVSLASLAARIAPGLCLNAPRQAIEAAARLIECAREWLAMPGADDEKASLANERAQLEADAERREKYGFKPMGRNLSLEDAFLLQKEERIRKGQAPYKTFGWFVKALREEELTRNRFPERTKDEMKEKLREGPGGRRLMRALRSYPRSRRGSV